MKNFVYLYSKKESVDRACLAAIPSEFLHW